MLISIDGVDGCGKSTQVRLLAEQLRATRVTEISDSEWGRKLRSTENPTLAQQLAWFTADRALLSPKLAPASGSPTDHVVSDRSYLSSVGYQSYDTGLRPSLLFDMGRAIMPRYDLQIVLDVPIDVAMSRIEGRGEKKTWCENPGLLTWASRVFQSWAARVDEIVLVDATQPPDAVFAAVLAEVERVATARFGHLPWN